MVAQTVKVVNEQGLHMRPAGVFAKEMTKFSCAVTLDVAGKKINAKSVMLIIAACIKCGAEVTIECDGADEKEALYVHCPDVEADYLYMKSEIRLQYRLQANGTRLEYHLLYRE